MEEPYGFKQNLLPPSGLNPSCNCANLPYPMSMPVPNHNHECHQNSTSAYSCVPPECSPCSPSTNFRPIHPLNEYKKAYYWVDTSAYGGIPSTALHGGVDIDGHQIYVGRAYHEGDWIPAKVIPGKNIAYIAYGGEEHAKDQFQVLCEQKFQWVQSFGCNIPRGAVDGGRTCDGEVLYIGRVDHNGSKTVGKVQPSHNCCYIPFDGKELSFPNYEILVLQS